MCKQDEKKTRLLLIKDIARYISIIDEMGEDKLESSSRYSLAIKRFGETDEFLLRHSRRIPHKVLPTPRLILFHRLIGLDSLDIRFELSIWRSRLDLLPSFAKFHVFICPLERA